MEKIGKHKFLTGTEYMAASDFRPRLPLKPNTVHFLVAMTVLLQGALAVCVHDLGAENMVNEMTAIFHYKCLLFFFFLIFIYLFIYGCVGSSFLCEGSP